MRIHGHTLIHRPPEVVFDFVADERNNYDPTIRHAELLTGEPIGVGTRFRCTTSARRRPIEMTVEIVDYDRPRHLVTTTRLSGMDITSSLRFDPDGDATRLHWSSRLRPHGLLKVLTPLLSLVGRRQTRAIWTGLKDTLEHREQGTPAAPTPALAGHAGAPWSRDRSPLTAAGRDQSVISREAATAPGADNPS